MTENNSIESTLANAQAFEAKYVLDWRWGDAQLQCAKRCANDARRGEASAFWSKTSRWSTVVAMGDTNHCILMPLVTDWYIDGRTGWDIVI